MTPARLTCASSIRNKRVQMVPVSIVKEVPEGLWVTGLPATATVITVGQELVTPGSLVDVSFEDSTMGLVAPPRAVLDSRRERAME